MRNFSRERSECAGCTNFEPYFIPRVEMNYFILTNFICIVFHIFILLTFQFNLLIYSKAYKKPWAKRSPQPTPRSFPSPAAGQSWLCGGGSEGRKQSSASSPTTAPAAPNMQQQLAPVAPIQQQPAPAAPNMQQQLAPAAPVQQQPAPAAPIQQQPAPAAPLQQHPALPQRGEGNNLPPQRQPQSPPPPAPADGNMQQEAPEDQQPGDQQPFDLVNFSIMLSPCLISLCSLFLFLSQSSLLFGPLTSSFPCSFLFPLIFLCFISPLFQYNNIYRLLMLLSKLRCSSSISYSIMVVL